MKPEVESPLNRIYISYNRRGHSTFAVFLLSFFIRLYQAASAAASPKYVKLHFFLKIFIFHKIIVAVFVYMFYC